MTPRQARQPSVSHQLGEDRVRQQDAAVREGNSPVADRHQTGRDVTVDVGGARPRRGKVALEPIERDALREPQPEDEALARNLALVDTVTSIAAAKDCTPAQLALAWVLAQGTDIVPIPGTKRRKYLNENLAALDIALGPEDLAAIEAAFPRAGIRGERYAPVMMALSGR